MMRLAATASYARASPNRRAAALLPSGSRHAARTAILSHRIAQRVIASGVASLSRGPLADGSSTSTTPTPDTNRTRSG